MPGTELHFTGSSHTWKWGAAAITPISQTGNVENAGEGSLGLRLGHLTSESGCLSTGADTVWTKTPSTDGVIAPHPTLGTWGCKTVPCHQH